MKKYFLLLAFLPFAAFGQHTYVRTVLDRSTNTITLWHGEEQVTDLDTIAKLIITQMISDYFYSYFSEDDIELGVALVDSSAVAEPNTYATGNMLEDGLALKANIYPFDFVITFDIAGFATPVDNTIYYFGAFGGSSWTPNATGRQMVIPYNCTLVGWDLSERSTATPTTETSTLSIRINNTTDVLLTNALVFHVSSSPGTYSGVGMATNLTAGDKIEFKLLTATWSTDATQVALTIHLYFKNL